LDNDTRWNSWFIEVEVALLKCRELRDWIDEHWNKLGDDALSREDWQELEDIKEFLQPFADCTLSTQGITATLDYTFESIELIVKHFTDMKIKHSYNPQMLTRILTGWFKFDKYYKLSDDTAVYAASILLHPELRRAYLKKSWDHQKQYIEPAVKAVQKVWKKYFKPESSTTLVVDLDTIKDPVRRQRLELTRTNAVIEEFEDFIKGTPIQLGTFQTPLEWWLELARQAAYPNLTRMAITIFTIPPMSAGPERVFSGGKHTIASERIRLGAIMVEMAECLKSWISITPGRQQAPLSGVFRNNGFVDEAIKLLEENLAIADGEKESLP
jgi:hypothetical protein